MPDPSPATRAPTGEEIERLARETIARLPDPYPRLLEAVALRVDDFAEDAILDELGIEDPFDLTGLYTGRPVGEKSSLDSGALPDMIHLFRRPLLEEWIDTGVTLEALIQHVVIHEAGHHLGLSDADMHAIEDAADE
ncbi:MAG: metallopeptidase family protein [Sphingomonas sp.]